MTFLPIVERELRVAARLASTYRNRSLVAGAVALAALVMLFFGSFFSSASSVGGFMFETLSVLTLLFCVVEGARKTADCLSEEKREGTLGLLFLTDLRGYDIVLGKLVGASLNSVYGLISILPVLALPLLLGGVLAGEYWRAVLALLNILFCSLCLGIFVSSISREEHTAMGGALLLMGAICVLPLLPGTGWLGPASPANAFYASFESSYRLASGDYWESLAAGQVLSWVLLVAACVVVPRTWQERAIEPDRTRGWRRWFKPWPRHSPWLTGVRRNDRKLNPITWLALRQPGVRFGLFCLAAIAFLGAVGYCLVGGDGTGAYLAGCFILNLVVKAWAAAQACSFNARARHNNTMEMLLVTPLTPSQIISGQTTAIIRIFLFPAFVILGCETFGYLGGLFSSRAANNNTVDEISAAALVGMAYLVLFALDMAAVVWVGMWFGLTSRKESHAIAKTVFFVLILPYVSLAFFFCLPGIPVFFFSSVAWMIWARGRLQSQFRERASQYQGFARPDATLLVVPQFNRSPPLPPIINR